MPRQRKDAYTNPSSPPKKGTSLKLAVPASTWELEFLLHLLHAKYHPRDCQPGSIPGLRDRIFLRTSLIQQCFVRGKVYGWFGCPQAEAPESLWPRDTAGARQLHGPPLPSAAVEPEVQAAAAQAFTWVSRSTQHCQVICKSLSHSTLYKLLTRFPILMLWQAPQHLQ